MDKLDLIMSAFEVEKKEADNSKDISEEVEEKSNDFKVKEPTIETIDNSTEETETTDDV